jgi:conjugative coupling factor TraD (TOL family)
MSETPLEGLLRPPVERISAIYAGTVSAFLALNPTWGLLVPAIAYPAALVAAGVALARWRQAKTIVDYQRNLRRLTKYELRSADIPFSNYKLFIGKGFNWSTKHAQRLMETRLPKNERYVRPNPFEQRARAFELRIEHGKFAGMRKYTQRLIPPPPPVGGDPAIHGVEPIESDLWVDLGERVGHTLILGTTRVGKTRLAEILITQDIRRGDTVIVFDPKGDADLLTRMYVEAQRAGRGDQFYMFHLGFPEWSARYNPIGSFAKITEVATRIAGALPGEGQSATFREFVWRYVNVIARALDKLGFKPSYEEIYGRTNNIDSLCVSYFEYWLDRDAIGWRDEFIEGERSKADKALTELARKTGRSMRAIELSAFIRERNLRDPVGEALFTILSNDKTYFEKLVASLYPLLEKLTTGSVSEMLSPNYADADDRRPIFDWMRIIESGGIVYVGLDALSDHEVAGAVGTAMFADLTSVAGQIYKHGQSAGQSAQHTPRKTSIYADEFNELIGEEFIPMVNKAGGAGYQVTALTQTWSDVEARIGNAAKAEQIGGNFNTLYMMRVKNVETAELLTKQLPEIELTTTTQSSSASEGADPTLVAGFTSRNEDKIGAKAAELVSASDLVKLPKGQAFGLVEGGRLVKIRMPLPAKDDVDYPSHLQMIADKMKARYERSSNAYEAMLTEGRGIGW